jgi:hypothetical protein
MALLTEIILHGVFKTAEGQKVANNENLVNSLCS